MFNRQSDELFEEVIWWSIGGASGSGVGKLILGYTSGTSRKVSKKNVKQIKRLYNDCEKAAEKRRTDFYMSYMKVTKKSQGIR